MKCFLYVCFINYYVIFYMKDFELFPDCELKKGIIQIILYCIYFN